MTPASFKSWRERLYGPRSIKAASDALGCSRTSIRAWEAGYAERYSKGPYDMRVVERKPIDIPRYIALACQALANGLPPMN